METYEERLLQCQSTLNAMRDYQEKIQQDLRTKSRENEQLMQTKDKLTQTIQELYHEMKSMRSEIHTIRESHKNHGKMIEEENIAMDFDSYEENMVASLYLID